MPTWLQAFWIVPPVIGGLQGNGTGTAQFRHPMVEPIVNFENSKLAINFEDISGIVPANPNRIRFCIAGRYIRPVGGTAPERPVSA
jgi:hypothetical protein